VHNEGLPLGTRGGILIEHLFPADGEYVFNINQSAGFGGGYIAGLDSHEKLVMLIDGQKVYEAEVGGPKDLKDVDQNQAPAAKAIRARFADIKLPVKAGPHKIGITFVARTFAESDDLRGDRGPEQDDGSRRYAEPAEDLHLPSEDRGRGAAVREGNREHARAQGVSPADHRGRSHRPDAFL
jgi:hypothetical protein